MRWFKGYLHQFYIMTSQATWSDQATITMQYYAIQLCYSVPSLSATLPYTYAALAEQTP